MKTCVQAYKYINSSQTYTKSHLKVKLECSQTVKNGCAMVDIP